jgi:glycine/D-amino acid oxidase-like deaminating enzyme
MKTENIWTDLTPRPEDLPISELPPKADVAVIGSGYTGLNAAITLAKNGAQVAILEKNTIGWGGSSRNGGLFSPGLSSGSPTIAKRYGWKIASRFWQWTLDACDYVEQIITSENITCDFHRNGQIHLAYKPSHLDIAKRYIDFLFNEYGYTSTRIIEKESLSREIGTPAYHGGVLEENAGGVDPARYTFGLARVAARYGVKLVENGEVKGIEKENGGYRLSTTKGEVRADEVLLATNGYTTNLLRKAYYGIIPAGTGVITTAPLSEELQNDIIPNNRVFYDSKNFLNYFRLTPDGRLLFGGRRSLTPVSESDLKDNARGLHRRMLEVFPQLEGIPISHTWTGRIGFTFDKMPHIGKEDGIHYAYGYCGHGLAAASYLGHEVGQLISGQRGNSLFSVIKHPVYFFAPWWRLYLPLATVGFKFLDLVS